MYKAVPHQTRQIVEALRGLAPTGATLTLLFEEIVQMGTQDKAFLLKHNDEWNRHTRQFIEAYFHARFLLKMSVKYSAILDETPSCSLRTGRRLCVCMGFVKLTSLFQNASCLRQIVLHPKQKYICYLNL